MSRSLLWSQLSQSGSPTRHFVLTFLEAPRPHTVMPPPTYQSCAFCGQMFGSASLPIHLKRCRSKPKHKPTADAAVEAALGALQDECRPAAAFPGDPQSPSSPLEEVDYSGPLEPCRYCSRTFHFSRVEKHERSCMARKSRKRAGPPLSPGGRQEQQRATSPGKGESTRTPSKWRQQHEEFLSVVRSNTKRRTKPLLPRSPDLASRYMERRLGTSSHARGAGCGCFSAASTSPARRHSRTVSYANAAATSAAASAEALHRCSSSGNSTSMSQFARPHTTPRGAASMREAVDVFANSPARRPTPAQRHAAEWHELSRRPPSRSSLPRPNALSGHAPEPRAALRSPAPDARPLQSRPGSRGLLASSPVPLLSMVHAKDLLGSSYHHVAPFSTPSYTGGRTTPVMLPVSSTGMAGSLASRSPSRGLIIAQQMRGL